MNRELELELDSKLTHADEWLIIISQDVHDLDTSRCPSVRGADISVDGDLQECLLYQRILRVRFGENR